MLHILQKIFSDRVYIHFLLFASCCMIFVVPIGSHVFRYLGPSMLLFFALTKFFQGELSRANLKRIKINKSMILFGLLLSLSCISFVPQTFGTMLIFATLYFGVKEKIVVNPRLAKVFLTVIMLLLAALTYKYVNRIPVYGAPINCVYLAVKYILFLLCCVKLSFRLGILFTIIGTFLITARTLLVSIFVYCLMQIPFIKNRLSAKSVAIFFCLTAFTLIGAGAMFSDKIIYVPTHPKYNTWKAYANIKMHKITLDRFSGERIRQNNNFFKSISGNYSKILFGDGLNYKGTKLIRTTTPVHNSFLTILARQGVLFLSVFLFLLYSYIAKHGYRNDFPAIMSLITFGLLFNGMFNTFPLILLLSLLMINHSPDIIVPPNHRINRKNIDSNDS